MDFNNNERNNQDPNKRKKNKTNLLICLMAALFAIGLIFFLNSEIQRNTEKEITYTKFIEMLKKDQVKKVTFQSNMIVIEPKTKEKVAMLTVTYYTGYVNDEKLVQDLLNKYGVELRRRFRAVRELWTFCFLIFFRLRDFGFSFGSLCARQPRAAALWAASASQMRRCM